MKQRVHGVVDVYGNRKPSYEMLRVESSPIESLKVEGHPKDFFVTITTRETVPAYRLTGYTLRGLYFGSGQIPSSGRKWLFRHWSRDRQRHSSCASRRRIRYTYNSTCCGREETRPTRWSGRPERSKTL